MIMALNHPTNTGLTQSQTHNHNSEVPSNKQAPPSYPKSRPPTTSASAHRQAGSRVAAQTGEENNEEEIVEIVKTETPHTEEEVEAEGVMTAYDETYGGQYEDPQYSDQYGLLDPDDSAQG